jgi:type IV secretory pathway VirB10-like protein
MADVSSTAGAAPVTDRRPVPKGVLPRGMQAWLMAGVAGGMVLIIVLTGRPGPAARPAQGATATDPSPNPDRLREYQDRLRVAEARAAQEATTGPIEQTRPATDHKEPRTAAPSDSVSSDRKRRAYGSLFASNVVLSRRPDGERPNPDGPTTSSSLARGLPTPPEAGAGPSVDQIADAVVRATVRAGGTVAVPSSIPQTQTTGTSRRPHAQADESAPRAQTAPISSAGPLHRILEGTIIETVLTNRLDGDSAAPVNCLVTNPVYSHAGRHVLIPAGARVLGETRAVQAFGETRLAVAFHRVVMPDGSTFTLDRPPGLNQIGDAGLRDRVNQHYWSTFGAAAAVGLVSGLSQFLGTAGLSTGEGNRTVVITGGVTDATSQAGVQVMNRFLNRLPTITIREGHRIKVYLTTDLELPAYDVTAGS